MSLDDPSVRVFFEVHDGLPREGPGETAATARALALAGPLPPAPKVLDIGCGPGMQTLDLAALLPDATITALDDHAPFLEDLRRRAERAGVGARVTTRQGDMRALPFPARSFDLVWCEGAAYIMGFANALHAWRPLLTERGVLALTEPVWLRADPPAAVRALFESYPAMADSAALRTLIDACGYRSLGDFTLPESAWWDAYYDPMQRRLAQLEPKHAGDPVAEAVLREHRDEIAAYRTWSAYYGYAFFVMTPQP